LSGSARKIVLPIFGLLGMLSACGDTSETAAPPPVPVEVMIVKGQAVPNVVELPGRIAAVRTAEVRARTDGIVERRLYNEGSHVAAGTPLFLIDPRDYKAQVQSAEAALQRTTAARQNAASIVKRYEPLMSERAVSAQEYDAARSDLQQAEAQVADARAALARAQLLLSHTTVRAPIAGRVGSAEVTEGALVSGAEGTLMTRVDQVSPVHAVFAESSASILDLIRQVRSGELTFPSLNRVEVKLILENGETYGPIGHLDFTSTVVDPETGTQVVRAQFDNPQQLLAPGQFVRGQIRAGIRDNGIVVPARAIQFSGEEAKVSVLGKDGTVSSRPVTLSALIDQGWIIRSGLKPGERVIVEGWQRARPGQKAQVKAAKRASPANPQQGR
jgi:RND family efflux transporter MFP subunit